MGRKEWLLAFLSGCCHHSHHYNSGSYARKSKVNNFLHGEITWQIYHFTLHKQITSSQSASMRFSVFFCQGGKAGYLWILMEDRAIPKAFAMKFFEHTQVWSICLIKSLLASFPTIKAKVWGQGKQNTKIPWDLLPVSTDYWFRDFLSQGLASPHFASSACLSYEFS